MHLSQWSLSTALLALSRTDSDTWFKGFSIFSGLIRPCFYSYKDNTYLHYIWIYYIYHISIKGARAKCSRSGEWQYAWQKYISDACPVVNSQITNCIKSLTNTVLQKSSDSESCMNFHIKSSCHSPGIIDWLLASIWKQKKLDYKPSNVNISTSGVNMEPCQVSCHSITKTLETMYQLIDFM